MEIAEIKSKLSLQTVLINYNLTPDRNNRLQCPWHNDKTPSLQIYENTNTWTCFSTNCNAGSGDVIDFIMKLERCTKHQAILKAKSWIDPVVNQIENNQLARDQKTKPMEVVKKPVLEITRIAILTKYYKSSVVGMSKSNKSKEYAEARNLAFSKLGIGYSGADVGKKWNHNLQLSAEQIGLLQKAGNTYRPKARYCLLFMMKNKSGQIVDIYGRSILDKPTVKHFYLSGTQKGLYPEYPKSDTRRLILTEGIVDAASLQQDLTITKDYAILSLYGTNGFTAEHRQAIRELYLLEEVIFFFDGDQAGEGGIKKWTREILKENEKLKISYVNTPKGEDVNSLLQGHDKKILLHLIEERKDVILQKDLFFSTESRSPDGQLDETGNQLEKKTASSYEKENSSQKKVLDKLNATNEELITYATAEIKITILGGIRITGLDRMKVTLKVESKVKPCLPIRHNLDLYFAKQVEHLCEMMASKLEIRSSKAQQIISQMTTALETYREGKLEAMKPKTPQVYQMTMEERKESIAYLKDVNLMGNTSREIKLSGIIGEEKNALIGHIINLSRKRKKPLHVMYLGASGMGKTHLQEGLSNLIPGEDVIEATSLSDQSLYYEGLKLKGKVLFIEDVAGAENVMYIIRELQSKGRIVKRVAWRDNKGHTQTIEVVAEGPVVISSCTTHEKVYEDNANRCILLYIDVSKEQDRRVLSYMKAKSTGKIREGEEVKIQHRMQNVQRTLRSIKVYNPYAELIHLPPEVFKPRRSLPLLLGFIESVTFYHQYQRELKVEKQTGEQFIRSTYEDIEISFDLLKDVLFSKSDELTKSARDFLELLKRRVKKGETFYTKKIRKDLRMNASNMKRYMMELQRYDYVKVSSGNRYRGYEYEVTDYSEYEDLKSSINKRLEAILLKVKAQDK